MLSSYTKKRYLNKRRSSSCHVEFKTDIKELHSRITTNYKELADTIAKNHKETEGNHVQQLRTELQGRVGVLEKWRWLIIGGSIVVGFIIIKNDNIVLTFKTDHGK